MHFRLLTLVGLSLASSASISGADEPEKRPPNILIVFTDDQGWGDLSCYGSEEIPTPNIDRLADEGIRFTDFYVSQPVCSASRASLLTGCYANRVGIAGALNPNAKHGLDPAEHTIAEVVKPLSYKTACFGKWHLGHLANYLPTRQGFDEYLGIPYSNDMWPGHPELPKNFPPLSWYDGRGPTESIDDFDGQEQITRRITKQAIDFIHRCGNQPFLLYVPHSMPHVPLGVAAEFRHTTMYGPYGDVIREIDWSVGQLREALEQEGVLDDTLIIYLSDNGPWLSYGDHAGTTGGLREGKGTTFEGGVRVPFICRYPKLVPAGTICAEPAMTIDILPTLVELTGGAAPQRQIDGLSILPLLRGDEGATSPHKALYFWYRADQLQAMRMGKWKLHFAHQYRTLAGRAPGNNGLPVPYKYGKSLPMSLYNLATDRQERSDVANQHPKLVSQMMEMANHMRKDLGDSLTGVVGREVRRPTAVSD